MKNSTLLSSKLTLSIDALVERATARFLVGDDLPDGRQLAARLDWVQIVIQFTIGGDATTKASEKNHSNRPATT